MKTPGIWRWYGPHWCNCTTKRSEKISQLIQKSNRSGHKCNVVILSSYSLSFKEIKWTRKSPGFCAVVTLGLIQWGRLSYKCPWLSDPYSVTQSSHPPRFTHILLHPTTDENWWFHLKKMDRPNHLLRHLFHLFVTWISRGNCTSQLLVHFHNDIHSGESLPSVFLNGSLKR